MRLVLVLGGLLILHVTGIVICDAQAQSDRSDATPVELAELVVDLASIGITANCQTYFQGTFLNCQVCTTCIYTEDSQTTAFTSCEPALGMGWACVLIPQQQSGPQAR